MKFDWTNPDTKVKKTYSVDLLFRFVCWLLRDILFFANPRETPSPSLELYIYKTIYCKHVIYQIFYQENQQSSDNLNNIVPGKWNVGHDSCLELTQYTCKPVNTQKAIRSFQPDSRVL